VQDIGDLYGAADLLLLRALIASAIERRTDEQTDVVNNVLIRLYRLNYRIGLYAVCVITAGLPIPCSSIAAAVQCSQLAGVAVSH